VRATSGDDGRFAFTLTPSERHGMREYKTWYQVMATAAGHGCDWVLVGPAGKELTLRLVKDVPIRGRILDPDGRPVAVARLTVIRLSAPRGALDGYLDWSRRGGTLERYEFARSWEGPPAGAPAVLTTGADGRFRLAGVGRERIVSLCVQGPGIAT